MSDRPVLDGLVEALEGLLVTSSVSARYVEDTNGIVVRFEIDPTEAGWQGLGRIARAVEATETHDQERLQMSLEIGHYDEDEDELVFVIDGYDVDHDLPDRIAAQIHGRR